MSGRNPRRVAPMVSCALVMAGVGGSALAENVVYQNNFESGATSGWSIGRTSMTPTERGFLGEFGNEEPTLNLGGLGAHTQVTLTFDLYLIRSWDGNYSYPGVGPDVWAAGYNSSDSLKNTLIHTTFANQPQGSIWDRPQAYPSATGEAFPGSSGLTDHGMYSGAMEINSLGYMFSGFSESSVYHMAFTFSHSDPSLSLWFHAVGLQDMSDESWGLDNVRVSTNAVPAPGVLALAGAGLGLLSRRRR